MFARQFGLSLVGLTGQYQELFRCHSLWAGRPELVDTLALLARGLRIQLNVSCVGRGDRGGRCSLLFEKHADREITRFLGTLTQLRQCGQAHQSRGYLSARIRTT